MKRNLLVLAAVLLLAVLLAGCEAVPINLIDVKYDVDPKVFRKPNYATQMKKNAIFEGVFWFLEDQRGWTVDDFKIKIDDGSLDGLRYSARNVAGSDFEGIYLQIPDVGTKNITISIKLKTEQQ